MASSVLTPPSPGLSHPGRSVPHQTSGPRPLPRPWQPLSSLCGCERDGSGDLARVESHRACPFASGFCHWASCPWGSSTRDGCLLPARLGDVPLCADRTSSLSTRLLMDTWAAHTCWLLGTPSERVPSRPRLRLFRAHRRGAADPLIILCLGFGGISSVFRGGGVISRSRQPCARVPASPRLPNTCSFLSFPNSGTGHPTVREVAPRCGFDSLFPHDSRR